MLGSALAVSVLLASGAVATPTKTRNAPSRVAARDTEPSSYPGGDGDACTNEFQYLNFDVSDDAQLTRVKAIHQAACTGLPQLLVLGYENLSDEDKTVFGRFFSNDDDTNDEVGQVYSALVDTSNGEFTSIVADMIIDNNDFQAYCTESGGDGGSDDGGENLGYEDTDDADGLEKFHLCDTSFNDFPTLPSDNECGETLDHPDINMDSLSRLLLHEMLHYSTVGEDIFGSRIVDVLNQDSERAYYPQRAHGLVDPDQDDDAASAVTNADSYAWHATNSYFKYACNNVEEPGPNGGNWNDPPAYTAGEPGDA
ncbi:hypothetical protein BJ166DRAFT_116719 [Pestalotiopsis sp. NC0098]|nr:hypothetical protein BJ166DRAFT_116719 [Pestalotiopsis sp. NC0098]